MTMNPVVSLLLPRFPASVRHDARPFLKRRCTSQNGILDRQKLDTIRDVPKGALRRDRHFGKRVPPARTLKARGPYRQPRSLCLRRLQWRRDLRWLCRSHCATIPSLSRWGSDLLKVPLECRRQHRFHASLGSSAEAAGPPKGCSADWSLKVPGADYQAELPGAGPSSRRKTPPSGWLHNRPGHIGPEEAHTHAEVVIRSACWRWPPGAPTCPIGRL
jgi:hypothetical protein